MTSPTTEHARWGRWTIWGSGLVVALGAGIATAHGLYQVALAAGTPRPLAWLYPLITDGLALVAYATTARLTHHGRRYAWTIVITAAGLSGLTQASYLAGGITTASPGLRFAIGAWPALAAATVAHLLYLLSAHHQPTTQPQGTPDTPLPVTAVPAPPVLPVPAATPAPLIHTPAVAGPPHRPAAPPDRVPPPLLPAAVQPPPRPLVQTLDSTPSEQPGEHPAAPEPGSVVRAPATRDVAPARVRAQTAASGHAAQHGHLPTVTELMALAQVARGTAAAALKTLRHQQNQNPTAKTTNQARTHR
jgi:hypothetical protein